MLPRHAIINAARQDQDKARLQTGGEFDRRMLACVCNPLNFRLSACEMEDIMLGKFLRLQLPHAMMKPPQFTP